MGTSKLMDNDMFEVCYGEYAPDERTFQTKIYRMFRFEVKKTILPCPVHLVII